MDRPTTAHQIQRTLNIFAPPLLYGLFIFVLSSQSFESMKLGHGMDKGVHLLLYSGFGYMILRAFKKSGHHKERSGTMTVLIVLAYGLFDEIHQSFVPNRGFEILDIAFDGLGAIAAGLLCGWADRLGWPIWF